MEDVFVVFVVIFILVSVVVELVVAVLLLFVDVGECRSSLT